ncbi:glycosyltransferase [Capnocytophaga sp. oral taxon 864]|nr:glycosyltransferase [Capnocytophaga sp. oral taxon 864]
MKKRCVRAVMEIRKETEKFRRGKGEVLVKKGYEKGGGSL